MKIIDGDITDTGLLVENHIDAIVHGCNIRTTMGAGLAKTIKCKFPEASTEDVLCELSPLERLGTYTVGVHYYIDKTTANFNRVLIGNLYQQDLGGQTPLQFDMLEKSFNSFVSDHKNLKIAVPWQIGCGLAGGDWSKVKPMIEKILENHKAEGCWVRFYG